MISRFLEQSPEIASGLMALVGLGVGALVARWVERMLAGETAAAAAGAAGASQSRTTFWTVVAGTGLLYGGFTWAMLVWEGQQAYPEVRPDIFWRYGRIVYHLVLITLLVAATATDWREYVIPDQVTLAGMLAGVAGATLAGDVQIMHVWVDANRVGVEVFGPHIPEWIRQHHHWHGLAWSLSGLACGGGATWLVRALSSRLLGQEALGFGDVTLMAMVGSFIGWQPVVCVLLVAPLCGLVVGLGARVIGGKRFVPFGPYLALATVIVLFTWRWIWRWEIPWRPGSTVSVRELFGDWPTLVILAGIGIGALVLLLGLLRLYRAIPVPARHDVATGGPPVAPSADAERQERAGTESGSGEAPATQNSTRSCTAPDGRSGTASYSDEDATDERRQAGSVPPREGRLAGSPPPRGGQAGGPPPRGRLFAIVPAAGHSRRMGRPKLLLPLGEATVVARLLSALDHPSIAARMVVVRPDDEPLALEVERRGGIVIRPAVPPPDMRTSVEHALAAVRERFSPRADDAWLLVPADHPVLEPALISRIVEEWHARRPDVLVPTCAGRRGHPTVFGWSLAEAVAALPSGRGLNQLVRSGGYDVVELETGDAAILADLDTPADYETLVARWSPVADEPRP